MAYNQMMRIAQQMARRLVAEQTQVRTQMMLDVALLTANELLGLGPGRADAFVDRYIENANELAAIFVEDGQTDPQLWYAKEKLDDRIRAIVGEERFKPFAERYGACSFDGEKVRGR